MMRWPMLLMAVACLQLQLLQANENITVASTGSGADVRRLQVMLPSVQSVDFQDYDLQQGRIGGTASWVPPSITSEVSGYKVYLTDIYQGERVLLGTVSGANTVTLAVPMNTSTAGSTTTFTNIFVHTISTLGESPYGIRAEICDVDLEDSLFVVNAIDTQMSWGVNELSFYESPICSGPALRWAETRSSGHLEAHPHGQAFDGNTASAWASNCTTCAMGSASLGVVGVCKVTTVRCLRIRQCNIASDAGCPASARRTTWLSLLVRGETVYTWKVLPRADVETQLWEEQLVIPGRRRRAGYTVASDTETRLSKTTSTGFSR